MSYQVSAVPGAGKSTGMAVTADGCDCAQRSCSIALAKRDMMLVLSPCSQSQVANSREASVDNRHLHRRIKNPAVANVNPNFCSRA